MYLHSVFNPSVRVFAQIKDEQKENGKRDVLIHGFEVWIDSGSNTVYKPIVFDGDGKVYYADEHPDFYGYGVDREEVSV